MPKDTSERGYKKGTGELGGDSLVESILRGLWPRWYFSAVIVEVMTDKKIELCQRLEELFQNLGEI